MNRAGPRQIRDMLQGQVRSLCARLFPGERIPAGPVFTPRNPTRDDRRPGSFVIWMTGPATGGFCEYSPRGAAKGDVIDLIAYVHGQNRAFALRWAEDFLGVRQMGADDLARAKSRARRRAREELHAASERAAKKRRAAMRLWTRAREPIEGSLAEVYLARRGIAWVALKHPEGDLRFCDRLEWWKGARWEVRPDGARIKAEPGPSFPAMVGAMRNRAGDITAVHCTFLRHDGTGKADVPEAKLMYGEVRGAVIRLAMGADGLTMEEAAENGVLSDWIIGEGIETMLTVALAAPEARVAAAASAGNIQNAYVDHPAIERVIVAEDNDKGAAAAERRQATRAGLARHGKPVAAMAAGAGVNDFNDLVKEET